MLLGDVNTVGPHRIHIARLAAEHKPVGVWVEMILLFCLPALVISDASPATVVTVQPVALVANEDPTLLPSGVPRDRAQSVVRTQDLPEGGLRILIARD